MSQTNQIERKNQRSGKLQGTTHTRNIGTGTIALLLIAIVAFFLTPFVLLKLGDTKYGIWTILITIFGLSGLLDFGLRSVFDQRFTRAWHKGNDRYIAKTYSTGKHITVILSTITVSITTILIAGLYLAPSVFYGYRTEAVIVMASLGTQAAATFLFFPHTAVITAVRRFDIRANIAILDTLLTSAATFACVSYTNNLGLLALSCIASKPLSFFLVRSIAKRYYIPPQNVKPSNKLIAIFLKTGFLRFISASGNQIIRQIDTITVFALCGIANVAPYALGATLAARLLQLQGVFRLSMQGEMLQLAARSKHQELGVLVLTITRYVLLLLIPPVLISLLYASDFFSLWIRQSPEVLALCPESVYRLLAIYSFCVIACSPVSQAVTALERHAGIANLIAIESALNLILSITLGLYFGSIGIAAATATACCLVHVPGRLIMCKKHITSLTFKKMAGAIVRPTICLLAFLPVLLFSKLVFSGTTWFSLFLIGLFTIGSWIPIAYAIGLRNHERINIHEKILRMLNLKS